MDEVDDRCSHRVVARWNKIATQSKESRLYSNQSDHGGSRHRPCCRDFEKRRNGYGLGLSEMRLETGISRSVSYRFSSPSRLCTNPYASNSRQKVVIPAIDAAVRNL